MWQVDISVDSRYELKNKIEQFLCSLKINYLYCNISSRDIFSIAEPNARFRSKIKELIIDILLIDIKLRYFTDIIDIDSQRDSQRILLLEMLYFDNSYERDYLEDILPYLHDYSIDGIYNFKMQEIRKNWDYLLELYDRVKGSSDDELMLAKYMQDSAINVNNRLYLTKKENKHYLFDIKRGHEITIYPLFNNERYDVVASVISTHASELYIEKESKFGIDIELLQNIVSLKFI